MRPAAIDRFWSKVRVPDENGCLNWIGTKGRGYGRFWFNRRTVMAHRWLYEYLVAPVPDELELDHLCRNPGCVNPNHLEPVTPSTNVLRGNTPRVNRERIRPMKIFCKQGHQLTPSNVRIYVRRDGTVARVCRKCGLEACKNWYRTHGGRRYARESYRKNHGWNGRARRRLTASEVIQIRDLAAKGVRQFELVKRFNVGHTAVSRAVQKKTWTHLEETQS